MVRKSSRKNKEKKTKPASAGAPSLNDRGRYQPQHKKATGPRSAAKTSKKSIDSIRKATTKVAAKKPVALPPPSGRRQSLRLLTSNKPKPAAASSASSKGKKKGAKGAAAEGSLFDTVKEMISSVLSRFTSSFA